MKIKKCKELERICASIDIDHNELQTRGVKGSKENEEELENLFNIIMNNIEGVILTKHLENYIIENLESFEDVNEQLEQILEDFKKGTIEFVTQKNYFSAYVKNTQELGEDGEVISGEYKAGYWSPLCSTDTAYYISLKELTRDYLKDIVIENKDYYIDEFVENIEYLKRRNDPYNNLELWESKYSQFIEYMSR
ncbi:MAG: hypothetical protein ACK5NF_06425 [Bacilli bacterium]